MTKPALRRLVGIMPKQAGYVSAPHGHGRLVPQAFDWGCSTSRLKVPLKVPDGWEAGAPGKAVHGSKI